MTSESPLGTLIMIHPHSTQMTYFQTKHLLKKISLHHYKIHYQFLLLKTSLPLKIQDFNQVPKPINLILHTEHDTILKMTY